MCAHAGMGTLSECFVSTLKVTDLIAKMTMGENMLPISSISKHSKWTAQSSVGDGIGAMKTWISAPPLGVERLPQKTGSAARSLAEIKLAVCLSEFKLVVIAKKII